MTESKTYNDRVKCPKGHSFLVSRRLGTAGKKVRTFCRMCHCSYQIEAGPVPVKQG
jgi:hypothetical protein